MPWAVLGPGPGSFCAENTICILAHFEDLNVLT